MATSLVFQNSQGKKYSTKNEIETNNLGILLILLYTPDQYFLKWCQPRLATNHVKTVLDLKVCTVGFCYVHIKGAKSAILGWSTQQATPHHTIYHAAPIDMVMGNSSSWADECLVQWRGEEQRGERKVNRSAPYQVSFTDSCRGACKNWRSLRFHLGCWHLVWWEGWSQPKDSAEQE